MTQAMEEEHASESADLPAADPPQAPPEPPDAPGLGNRVRMLVAGLLLTCFAAVWCNAILDLFESGGDFGRLFSYGLDEARLIFLLSSGVLWLLILGLVALTGRLFITVGVFTALSVIVGFANYQKLELRREPIYPSDLAFAGEGGFLTDMVGAGTVVKVAAAAIGIVLISVLLGRLASRVYPRVRRKAERRRWRALLATRVVTLVAVVVALSYVLQFNGSGNQVRGAYEASGARWAWWFQEANYRRNGFVAGFLYNLPGPAMTEPEDYSRATMARLTKKYEAVAEGFNQGRATGTIDDVNIVLVLSEAFSDPTKIDGPVFEEDPIPYTRAVMSRTRSGEMLAQLYGGGTANMEFESLTGMSLSQFLPQMNTPYQMLVTNTPTFPSAVGYLNRLGHRAVGIHPYMTTMYKRYEVYPTLGFEKLVDEDTMQRAERIGEDAFVSDDSAYDEVVHQLREHDDPLLVNLVTMQNHYPMADTYDDPVDVRGVGAEVAEQLSHYLRGLRLSDTALEEFLQELRTSDEKTAVVFYGDHAPAFWRGDVYDRNGDDAFRRTPYFMWTNFERLDPAEDPLTSPIYFLPTLFDDLQAPLSPYYALLMQLKGEIAAMEQGEYFLPDGTRVTEEQLSSHAKELLHDYRLVQYDLAVGQRYSLDEMFYEER